MPFTHIALAEGKPVEYRNALMEQIYLAMRETIAIPEDDRFATISEHKPENLNNSGDYLGVDRSDDVVFIRITLNQGRTVDQKKALYAMIAKNLAADPGVRPEDLVITLIEVGPQDWSLGNGLAQYA
jgi:phenylpyruvate tautomerase PptA (4-oxalocrotonate tautomerase family)